MITVAKEFDEKKETKRKGMPYIHRWALENFRKGEARSQGIGNWTRHPMSSTESRTSTNSLNLYNDYRTWTSTKTFFWYHQVWSCVYTETASIFVLRRELKTQSRCHSCLKHTKTHKQVHSWSSTKRRFAKFSAFRAGMVEVEDSRVSCIKLIKYHRDHLRHLHCLVLSMIKCL